MDQSSVAAAGQALVASVGNMTTSASNKLQDVSRKVTLATLLDDKSSSSTTTSDKAAGKENSSGNSAASRGLAGKRVLSDRGNNNNNNNSSSNTSSSTAGAGLANHGDLEALRDLRDLSAIVSEVERRAAALREAIDSHRRDNVARRAMSDATRQQTAQLAATLSALPEHLPHAAAEAPARGTAATANGVDAPAAAAAAAVSAVPPARSGGGNRRVATKAAEPAAAGGGDGEPNVAAGRAMAEIVPPGVELVTVGELNGVPRSTRGRLTIEQVNAAVADIQKAIERRHAFLAKPRKKMSEKQRGRLEELLAQEVPAHGGRPFIAEPDLRALPAFKKGEMTAKALIATLRNLKRLKGVRGTGMMTYVV